MKNRLLKKITACILVVVMVGTLASGNGVVKGIDTASGTTGQTSIQNENIHLTKTAEWDDEAGTATVRLESYITGKVTTTTVPSDIVLVLDASGSMENPIDEDGQWVYTQYDSKKTLNQIYNNSKRTTFYYQLENGEYKNVEIKRERQSGQYTYSISYGSRKNKKYICQSENGNKTLALLGIDLYTREWEEGKTKIEALREAVARFINLTAEENNGLDKDKQSRISIVKFAGQISYEVGNKTHTEYQPGSWGSGATVNYSQIVADLTAVDNLSKESLIDKVNAIKPAGQTLSNNGLNRAEAALQNYDNERNKVVIMFTDGEPSAWSDYSSEVANGAIFASRKLKTNNTTVYTIGVFEDADPTYGISDWNEYSSTKKTFNRYMHAVSSNYPNAVSMKNIGNKNPTKSNYYMSATNSEELNQIFENINEEISSSANLDENAYVSDVISDEFKCPEDADINMYTSEYTGKNVDGERSWGEPVKFYDGKIIIDKESKEVKVSGFDYNKNMVLEDAEGNPKGSKLIIEITLKPIDGFIGGNGVLTNKSAALKDEDNIPQATTDVNPIDIPLLFDFDAQDAAIYVGSDWNKIERFLHVAENGNITYSNTRNDKETNHEYTFDGLRNKYVTVVYTVTDKDGKSIGIYTVKAGETRGSWEKAVDINSEDLRECTTYKVYAKVIPINEKSGENDSGVFAEELTTDPEDATLHIMVPEVTLNDDHIFLGENSDLTQRVEHKEKGWMDIKNHTFSEKLEIEGTKELTYKYAHVAGSEDTDDEKNTYTPYEKQDAVFHVDVKNGNTDITDATVFTGGSGKHLRCNLKNHFTVKVEAGQIVIHKNVFNANNVKPTQGDAIFTFKIEGTLDNGEKFVKYEAINFSKNNGVPITLSELKKGTYTITELDTMRYAFESLTNHEVFSPADVVTEKSKATIFIGMDRDAKRDLNKQNADITYTNKLINDDDTSAAGIIKNGFMVGNDGSVTIKNEYKEKQEG